MFITDNDNNRGAKLEWVSEFILGDFFSCVCVYIKFTLGILNHNMTL
jgi:hypothetical protein